MVRIFSKKTFGLGPGAQKDGTVDILRTVVNGFMDVPEKYTQCKIWDMAVASGDITIIEDKSMQDKVAKEALAKKAEVVAEPDAREEFAAKVKAMKKEEAIKQAEELNVVLTGDEKIADIKKKIMAAYDME